MNFKSNNDRILETLQMQPLSDEEKKNRHILGRLYGPIATCKESTRNGRKYNRALWEKALNDNLFEEKIAHKSLFLELGHPADREETDMEKVCACIPEMPKIIDDDLYAYVDILDTKNGRLLKTLCDYGFIPGISSRGSGDIMDNDEVDPDTFFLETWDIVQTPAVEKARLTVCESLDKTKQKLNKVLAESYRNSNEEDKKLMKETLSNLNMDIKDTEEKPLEEASEFSDLDGIKRYPNGTPMDAKYVPVANPDPSEDIPLDPDVLMEDLEENVDDEVEVSDMELDDIVELDDEQFEEAFKQKYEAYLNEANKEDSNTDEKTDDTEEVEEVEEESDDEASDEDSSDSEIEDVENEEADDEESDETEEEEPTEIATVKDLKDALKAFKNADEVEINNISIEGVEYAVNFAFNKDEDTDKVIIDVNCQPVEGAMPEENVEDTVDYVEDNIEASEDDIEAFDMIDDEEIEADETDDIETDEIENESEEAVDNGNEDVIESLKESIRQNTKLEQEVIALKKKQSVSDAKEAELKEQVARLSKSLDSVNESAKHSTSVIKKLRKQLTERAASLTENADQNKSKIKALNEELAKVKANSEETEKVLQEQIAKYKQLVADRNAQIKRAKAQVTTVLESYISSKASMLGVPSSEIVSRLSEQYSMKDIDKVCDEILTSAVNMNRLPFGSKNTVSKKINESVSVNRRTNPDEGYDVDDELLKLAGISRDQLYKN